MVYEFDVDSPADDDVISEYPTNERAERTTVKNVVTTEHDEASGHHAITIDTEANRDLITDWVAGGFFIANDVVSGGYILQITPDGGTTWLNIPCLSQNQEWTKGQYAPYVTLTESANDIDSDWTDGSYFKITLDGDYTLTNPTTPASGKAQSVVYEFTQDGTGNRVLSFDTNFRFSYGITPVLSTGAGEVDYLFCTLRSDGYVHAVLSPKSEVAS